MREEGSCIVIRHPEAPLLLRVSSTGRGVEVRLEASGVDDYLEELVETSPSPREVVEQHIDDLTGLALELARRLEGAGYSVDLRLRDTAMDVLERLEEMEES